MQCCLEPLRQYCIGFSAVKCCPNSIKTTLHWIFSNTMLSGAFQATLHRVLTCPMLSGASQTALHIYIYIYIYIYLYIYIYTLEKMLKLITISSQFETRIFFTIESQAEDVDNKVCYLLFIY